MSRQSSRFGGRAAIGADFFHAESGSFISDQNGYQLRSGLYAPAASYPIAATLEHCKISGLASTNSQSYLHIQSADNGAGTIVMTYSVATGSNVLVSTDGGATFSNVSTGLSSAATGVVWDGTRFIVAGNDGANFYTRVSTNGTSWSAGGTLAHTSVTAGTVRLAYNGTVTLGIGTGSSASNASAFTTTDGTTLTGRTAPTSAGGTSATLQAGGGTFVRADSGLGTTIYTSTDGISWTSRTLPSSVSQSAYLGGTWMLKEDASLLYYTTTNFTTFTARTLPGAASGLSFRGSISSDSSRVYAGVYNAASTVGQPMVMWSSDLISWQVRGLTAALGSNTVWHCHGGKYFFAKGANASTSILYTASFGTADFVGAAQMTSTPLSNSNPAVMYRKLAD